MIRFTTKTLALAIAMAVLSSGAFADTSPSDFTFSDDLAASFEAHNAEVDAFNDTIETAIDGLSDDEIQAVFETYAEEAEALRADEQTLRDEGVAEMEASGVTPAAQDDRNRPEREDASSTSDSDDSDAESTHASSDNDRPKRGPRPPRPSQD